MSKLTRVTQKIFGSLAGLNQIAEFGTFAQGSPAFSTDPAAIQTNTFLAGWFSAVLGDNSPCIEDMNALFYVIAYQLAYLMQEGIAEWDSATTYYIGSLVNSSGVVYASLTNNNLNNAVTDGVNWKVIVGNPVRAVTANFTVNPGNAMIEADATTGNITATLPSASAMANQKVTITKMDSSTNTVTVGSFSTLLVGQYDSMTIFSNGSIWYIV